MRTSTKIFAVFLFIGFVSTLAAQYVATTPKEPINPKDLTKETEKGIPVKDQLTIAKCSGCHQRDSNGNLSRISWIRTTPEGWQEALKRMVELNGLSITPEDARQIVHYLSNEHGLAPSEVDPVRWYLESTMPQTESWPDDTIRQACASCHAFARPQTWRRSAAEWQLLKNMHLGYFPLSDFVAFSAHLGPRNPDPNAPKPPKPAEVALKYLTDHYGLYSEAWSSWQAQETDPDLTGRWVLSASMPGKGKYYGEMTITQTAQGEFKTDATLMSARDGSKMQFPGKAFVYTGYEWRGATKVDKIGSVRQVMALSADQQSLKGRWYWGAYDEFGWTIKATRASDDVAVFGVDVDNIRAGSKDVTVKIFGSHLPGNLKAAEIHLGSGVTVDKVVTSTATEITAKISVDPKITAGLRPVSIRGRTAPDAFGVYEKIEYIKITAPTAIAHTGGTVAQKGYVQYEAHGYSSGVDGVPNTADDIDLGPVPVAWSIEEFISHNSDDDKQYVGEINGDTGLFTPSGDGPNPKRRLSADNIGDVWVLAKYVSGDSKEPLDAKSYLVVSVPHFAVFDTPELAGITHER